MNKRVPKSLITSIFIGFLAFSCLTASYKKQGFNFTGSVIRKLTVKTGEKFVMVSRTQKPNPLPDGLTYDTFRWTDDNKWHLTNYPKQAIQFISTDGTAPDGDGGALTQSWLFKALSAGTHQLVFQQEKQLETIEVTVLPETMPIIWDTPEKWLNRDRKIELKNGDENYRVFLNDTINIYSPTQFRPQNADTRFSWKEEDRWKLLTEVNPTHGIVLVEEDESAQPDYLYHTWRLIVTQTGFHTLVFKKQNELILINIKVE